MRFLSTLFGGDSGSDDVCRSAAEKLRAVATHQLVTEINVLLDDGYDKDQVIRARGPLVDTWHNAVAWFGGAQSIIIANFIRSRTIWQNHESAAIEQARSAVHEWCIRHGATIESISRCEKILEEGLRRFKPIFEFDDVDAIQSLRNGFRAWTNQYPDLRDNFGRIILFLAEDGFVFAYLNESKAIFNDHT